MFKWTKILEEKQDSILEALKSACNRACGNQPNSGFREEVILEKNGAICICTGQTNCVPMSVHNGDALLVGAFEWFDPWDEVNDFEETVLNNHLTPEEKEDFLAWMKQKQEEDYNFPYSEYFFDIHTLYRWNSEVAERIEKIFEDYFDEQATEWAERVFDSCLEEHKIERDFA